MRYISTRGLLGGQDLGFWDILLEGLAPDGGLYLPREYPRLSPATLAEWRTILDEQGYAALAHAVLSLFIDGIPEADLRGICERAYNGEVFSDPAIVPVTRLGDGLMLAHLSNGPTAAFKDMAMQLLGQLFEYELARRGAELNILGATSGDTGSAAEYAMRGRRGVRVFMLTPAGRMTPFQQAQMFSIDDPAIVNIAVDGVFDDCQDLVKEVASDLDFKQRYSLGAVNSINWARLVAQVVYYVAAWLRATTEDSQLVSFCVPTGNFGNICAGHVARMMGVPIKDLVLATNENNVLDEFFRTGIYRVRSAPETHATSSPSMDISKASNFERFVFDLLGRDGERVRRLFAEELPRNGFFDLSTTPEFASLRERYGFVSGSSTHADRVATIAEIHGRHGVLIDPHTADGVTVAAGVAEPGVPMVVLETALPVKFAATIVEAIGREPERPAAFEGLEDLPRHVVGLPKDAEALKALIAETVHAAQPDGDRGGPEPHPTFPLGPFARPAGVNPIISANPESTFHCPMTKQDVRWEESDTFNPAAVVQDGAIQVLYRAEDNSATGIGSRTSRLALAASPDGLTVTRPRAPVLFPADDANARYEWPGGCEDPRLAVTEDGTFVLFYTAWDREVARLCVATSTDLRTWEKRGPAFARAHGGRFLDTWSKAASILTTLKDGRLVITRVNGSYFMYWGEYVIYGATSDDLVNWVPLLDDDGGLRVLMAPRNGYFDSELTECGPPAIWTEGGVILLYNGKNKADDGDPAFAANAYCAGQALFEAADPTKLISRLDTPFLAPEESVEKSGQYPDGTIFIEGLVFFEGSWFLYYGAADSHVSVAVSSRD